MAERYQDTLLTGENLSLLPLIVGGQRYIEAFVNKFPELYQDLKNQTIQLNNNEIGFFSVIALRKEKELLDTVLAKYVLKELKEVLQKSESNPLYGVLETATLVQNEEFIRRILDVVERDVKFSPNGSIKKNLLKNSFIIFLETAISQERASTVEYLCKRCIECDDHTLQKIYKEAFADNRIIEQIKKQVLKNIDSAGNVRKEKKQKIYDLILQVVSRIGNADFIEEVLDLIEKDKQFSFNKHNQVFLQNSLTVILDNAVCGKHFSIIQNVYTNFMLKPNRNSRVEFLALRRIYRNAFKKVSSSILQNFDEYTTKRVETQDSSEMYQSVLIVASLTDNVALIKKVLDSIEGGVRNDSKEQQVLLKSLINILTHAIANESSQTIQYICYERFSKIFHPAIQETYVRAFVDREKELDKYYSERESKEKLAEYKCWIELKEDLKAKRLIFSENSQVSERALIDGNEEVIIPRNKTSGSEITQLTDEKSQLLKKLSNMQQNLKGSNLGNENKKLPVANDQSRGQSKCASIAFVIAVAFAVGASLTVPYLAICIALTVAAFAALAVGFYCLYKANTALNDVEADQVTKNKDKKVILCC